jgi:hypothetical protein
MTADLNLHHLFLVFEKILGTYLRRPSPMPLRISCHKKVVQIVLHHVHKQLCPTTFGVSVAFSAFHHRHRLTATGRFNVRAPTSKRFSCGSPIRAKRTTRRVSESVLSKD